MWGSTTYDNNSSNNNNIRQTPSGFVSQIPEGKDGGASDLLHHLPLLRPTNNEAKLQYLSIIPKVLAHAVTSGVGQPAALENARQLLSYSLIHPAISAEERRALTHWLRALEDRLADLRRPAAHLQHSQGYGNNSSRSCSLGPGGSKSRWNDSSHLPPPDTGQDDSGWCGGSSSSGGGPSMEAPQSPNNSATSSHSSGCDTDDVPPHHHPGMRDVGAWLKSLRLHKYSPLLCNLTYQELLALDETTLESQGVTKGARHKIVLSIEKLKDRHKSLLQIEKDVMSGGVVSSALAELKSIIITPFPLYNGSGSEPSAAQYCSVEAQVSSTSIITNSSSSTSSTVSSSAAAPPCSASSTTPPVTTSMAASQSVPATVHSCASYTSSPGPLTSSSSTTTTAPSSISSSTSSSLCSIRGEELGASREEYSASSAAGDGTKSMDLESEGPGSSNISETDLPSHFTRVMGKVCTALLVCVRPSDECVSGFLGLVEKCLNHEAFTAAHARRLLSWKQQIIRVWHPLPPKNKDVRHNQRRWSQQYSGEGLGLGGGSFRMGRGSCGSGLGVAGSGQRGHPQIPPALLLGAATKAFQSPQQHPLFSYNGQALGNLCAQRNSLTGLPSLGNVNSLGGLLSPQQFLAKRPSLQETPFEQLRPHITLQRTRSAPSRPHSSAPTRPHQLPLSRAPHVTQQTSPHTQSQHAQLDHRSSHELLKCNLGSVGSSLVEGSSSHFSHYNHLGTSSSSTGGPPPSPHQTPAVPGPPDSQHDNDITDRLESLCLSVTEHALG